MNLSGQAQAERQTATRHTSTWALFLHRPRKLLIRRALFQVHLWTGLALALYVVVIALSGAILVFKAELTATLVPRDLLISGQSSAQQGSVSRVVRTFNARYPGGEISELVLPSAQIPAYQISAIDAGGHRFTLFADPAAAQLLACGVTWLDWMRDLHYYLLLGTRFGMQINGIASGILLACAISGLVVWWPGVAHWHRGMQISLRSRWRRINYDTHSAIGFWTLALVLWWALSGVYFGWYRPIIAVVAALSPLQGMVPPSIPVRAYNNSSSQRASLETIVAAVQRASPAGRLYSIDNASLHRPTLTAEMNLRHWGDFSHSDIVTVDTVNGRVLGVWHYGDNRTIGDWILWAMHPLHFGTLWGRPVKVLWSLCGVGLAVLSGTGAVMYWNRYLRHQLR